MKECPSCGYANPDGAAVCAVCGGNVSGVVPKPPPPPSRTGYYLLAAGAALVVLGAAVYLLPSRRASVVLRAGPPAAGAADKPGQEAPFSYDGVLASLKRMSELKYLPEGDKLGAAGLMWSRDEEAGFEAARMVGGWVRTEPDRNLALALFGKLLDAAASAAAGPRARLEAAVQAGTALWIGFDPGRYSDRVGEVARGLASGSDPELESAGFFLSAMAGRSELAPQMEDVLAHSPSPSSRLYAACALSRLGIEGGYSYLAGAAAGRDAGLRTEAISCLSYSASPEAGRLLRALEASTDPAVVKDARKALLIRGYLK